MKTFNVIFCLGVFLASSNATPAWITHYMPSGFASRTGAVAFTIGTIAYVGTGTKQISTNNPTDQDFRDFWAYDSEKDSWTQKTDFANTNPGLGGLKNGVGFAIGSKGYIGTGGNYGGNSLTDFWEYDPSNNSWTVKTPFGGVISNVGVAFAIGLKGYIRSGDINAMTNGTAFWEFYPTNNTWTQKVDLGIVRRSAVGFSLNNGKGYIGTGLAAPGAPTNSASQKDFYAYDPSNNSWVAIAPLAGQARANAVGFSNGSKGYVGLGYDTDESQRHSFWEYNPTTDSWAQILDYPITPASVGRAQPFGFAINNNLYVGAGNWGTGAESNYFSDFYEYSPSGAPVLPVELTTINATTDAQHEQVNVNWQTATETQSAYFAIERQSKTSHQFEEIGRVKGAGNSAKALTYNFKDEKPVYGVSYYRLRLVDIDGKTNYSKTVSVSYKGGAKIKVFPTYTDGYITIENGDKPIDGVYVWNASGQLMLQSKQTQLDLSDLPRGLYLVQVKVGSETFVQKITKW